MSTSASASASASTAPAKEAPKFEGLPLLVDSMRSIKLSQSKQDEESKLSKSQKKRNKAKAKSKVPQPQASTAASGTGPPASGTAEYKVSDDAVRLAVQAFPVEEGIWQRAQRNGWSPSAAGSVSSGGYTLSAPSVQKLMSLNTIMSTLFKPDLAPLDRLQCLLFMDVGMDMGMGSDHPIRSRTEASLTQALDELDEASMELLSPELQVLKRGLDELQNSKYEWRRVERQINELLRAEGEAEMQLPRVVDRMDRSLPIPTRVPKTAEEKQQQREEGVRRLKELRTSKPQLHEEIAKLLVPQHKKVEARIKAAEEAKKEKAATAATAESESTQADEKVPEDKMDTNVTDDEKVESSASA